MLKNLDETNWNNKFKVIKWTKTETKKLKLIQILNLLTEYSNKYYNSIYIILK